MSELIALPTMGEILKEEFLIPLNLSASAVARAGYMFRFQEY